MNKSEMLEILSRRKIRPSKKLGQNFICENRIIDRIIEAAAVTGRDTVLEIGAGLGALTGRLADTAKRVVAVEIDSGIARYLLERYSGSGVVRIVHADFLKVHFDEPFSKIVSNLPYFCTSDILFKIMNDYPSVPVLFVMVQKEVADRLVSAPGSKAYGAITVSLGLYYESEPLFRIPRSSFFPRPDVTSTFIRMKRRDETGLSAEEALLYHLLVKSAFWGRRKTLLRALSGSPHMNIGRGVVREILRERGIDELTRGEELDVGDFRELARSVFACIRTVRE